MVTAMRALWVGLLLAGCSEPSVELGLDGGDAGFSEDAAEPDVGTPDMGVVLETCTPEYTNTQAVAGGMQPKIAGRIRGNANDNRFIVAVAQPTTFQQVPNPPVESTSAMAVFFRERTSEVGLDLATGPLDEITGVLAFGDSFAIAMSGAAQHGATRPQGTFTLFFENDRYHMSYWSELDPGLKMIDAVPSPQGIINVLRAPGTEAGPVFLRFANVTTHHATYDSQSDVLDFEADGNGRLLISEVRSGLIVISSVDPALVNVVNELGSVPACAATSHRIRYQEDGLLVVLDCADRVELMSISPDMTVQWTAIVHEGTRGPTASQLARAGDIITVVVQDEALELAAHFFRPDGSRQVEAVHRIDTNTSLPFSYDLAAVRETFAVLLSTLGETTAIHELHRFSTCAR